MPYQVPRFGLVCGLVSSFFMLTMCALRRYAKGKLSRKKAMLIAALVSSLPVIFGMNPREQNLFKLLIYPLMFRCLFTKIFEMGLLPSFKHGEIAGYFLTTFFYGHCQLVETYS